MSTFDTTISTFNELEKFIQQYDPSYSVEQAYKREVNLKFTDLVAVLALRLAVSNEIDRLKDINNRSDTIRTLLDLKRQLADNVTAVEVAPPIESFPTK